MAAIYNPPSSPIGIVAGNGLLPLELINALKAAGTPHYIAAIKEECTAPLSTTNSATFSWGEIGKILKYFKNNECQNVVLIGGVTRRPDFTSILGDPATMRLLPKIIAAMSGGDDNLLGKVIKLIENEGFNVLGIDDVAPDLLLDEGHVAGPKFPKKLASDLQQALAALKDLGRHDVGQALVIENGRIIAVEGAEGTDMMLERVAFLRKSGRLSNGKQAGFLLKLSKAQQDRRVDLPAIGPDTVLHVKNAGLSGIVAEAGSVLLANKEKLISEAKTRKIFLYGQRV